MIYFAVYCLLSVQTFHQSVSQGFDFRYTLSLIKGYSEGWPREHPLHQQRNEFFDKKLDCLQAGTDIDGQKSVRFG